MRLTELLPAGGASHDVGTDAGEAWLRSVYAPPSDRYVRLNMITALTGAAAGADGTSDTLSSRIDRKILGVIRDAADVVLVGAGSVRAEGYVVPRRARLAVLTTSGDLGGARLDADADRVLLVCPRGRGEEVRRRAGVADARVIEVDDADPARIRDALADAGAPRIVCEGGPTVAGRFAAADLVDEYCVTVAPVLEPAERPFLALPPGSGPRTRPAGMLVDDAGFSYLRLRRR